MRRQCVKCGRDLTAADFVRDASRNMEADRKAAGLEGVRFLYYRCPCGVADVFVDVLPRHDELMDDFNRRVGEMEEAVRGLHADGVAAQVVPVAARDRA
jgi:hypothetical protein